MNDLGAVHTCMWMEPGSWLSSHGQWRSHGERLSSARLCVISGLLGFSLGRKWLLQAAGPSSSLACSLDGVARDHDRHPGGIGSPAAISGREKQTVPILEIQDGRQRVLKRSKRGGGSFKTRTLTTSIPKYFGIVVVIVVEPRLGGSSLTSYLLSGTEPLSALCRVSRHFLPGTGSPGLAAW